MVSVIAENSWKYGQLPFQNPHQWSTVNRDGDMTFRSEFWQDRFLQLSYLAAVPGAVPWELKFIDPRTSAVTSLKGESAGNLGPNILKFGSRVWVIGNKSACELVEGSFKPSSMVQPAVWPDEQERFLLAGEPAFVQRTATGFAVSTFNAGLWTVSHQLELPAGQPPLIDGIPINFNAASRAMCLNQGDRIHLFLDVEGRMLHHEGLDLRPIGSIAPNVGTGEQPVSALEAEKTLGGVTGWTVVNKMRMEEPGPIRGSLFTNNKFGIFLNGQPAVVLVDASDESAVIGRFLQLENGKWTEFATQAFPFGTESMRAVSCDDHQTAFVVAITAAGFARVYEVNANGVHATHGVSTLQLNSLMAVHSLLEIFALLILALMIGGLFGLGATVAMWCWSRPDYAFGNQHVRLAAIGWRALARLIDLGLIVFSTVALAWWLTRQMDWLSLAEAMSLRVAHPAIQSATRILAALLLWVIVCEGLIVVIQARWGLTAGKWCCGLRSVQTSLRPCGIARSLVREFVLWFDACGFLCWTPGIASIALTDRRQRLGDLIADTIVVNASTLKSK